jgi:hypothetical protein
VIRDIRRKIAGDETLRERFADLLALTHRVRFQDHRQRGPKVYALHAPEVECIGKGKARAPYEFGCKSLPLRRQGCRSPPRRPVEPVIGHTKAEHRMSRNYLKGRPNINTVDDLREIWPRLSIDEKATLAVRFTRIEVRPWISGILLSENREAAKRRSG